MRNFLIFCTIIFFGSQLSFAQDSIISVKVPETQKKLLSLADTDGDNKITIDDAPKAPFWLVGTHGDSLKIQSIYFLSNLLQELSIAKNKNEAILQLPLSRIRETPTHRISRRIRTVFWDDLTRTIDRAGLAEILADDKTMSETPRLYIPHDDPAALHYYKNLQQQLKNFELVQLPKKITPKYVKFLNNKPGLLALKVRNEKPVPFVVPGGRFNEMYGWDSYFIGKGLLIDGKVELARDMVDNFVYEINHYGKILNANRTYYLTRTQPPFLTSFIREVFEAMEVKDTLWLKNSLAAATKEYKEVWMEPRKRLTSNGLNRYFAEGTKIPPETEKGHFRIILQQYADKHHMPLEEFRERYNSGNVPEPELDEYFLHDRSMRESGHDTSWRLVNKTAFLNPVGLNSLLYKYETDFEYLIQTYFDGMIHYENGNSYGAGYWKVQANRRQSLMNKYLWDEKQGSFFDYNFKEEKRTDYISATNFYPLWAELATASQAEKMQGNLMRNLKAKGGFLASAGISVMRNATGPMERQWDYPYGWAPHQMLLWEGLQHYGYQRTAQEMIYRWLWTINKNAVNYNGTIPEKYNVVGATHKVYAEYGNVGTDFSYITNSGFGWMNASYQLGLELLDPFLRKRLDQLEPPGQIFQ